MFKPAELPFRRRTWLDLAAIPTNRRGWELEDCDDVPDKAVMAIQKWLKSALEGRIIRAEGAKNCGVGLFLYGSPGHGKTTLALAALQEIIRTFPFDSFAVKPNSSLSRPCYFIQYSELLELRGATFEGAPPNKLRLWEGILGECKEDTYNVRVLVIDDIGREHNSGTGWEAALLHHVLRVRFNNGLPTIVTTNHRLEDWGNTYGPQTESFAHEAFIQIELRSVNGDLRK